MGQHLNESINSVINDLVWPTCEIGRVIGAVAKGDLLESVPLETERPTGRRRIAQHSQDSKHNGVTAQFFCSRGDAVAMEVGTKGKLGGQADVKGLSRRMERPD